MIEKLKNPSGLPVPSSRSSRSVRPAAISSRRTAAAATAAFILYWPAIFGRTLLAVADLERAIELGCGTGYVSAWMRRRGASVYAIDNSERQLATARRLATEHGVEFTLHHGSAEAVPYPDHFFDFAISEYGAAIWCDPYLWIPEAHRLLRPGGSGPGPGARSCAGPGRSG